LAKSVILFDDFENIQNLEKRSHLYETRNQLLEPVVVPKYKNRFGARTLSVLLPVICNEVPTHLKKSRGRVELKNKIKKFYII
jgi:hypothetical protein